MHAPAQYLGSQLSHAVVLDGTTWQVSVGQEGKLVDGSRTCPRKNAKFSLALHVTSKPSAGSTCSISPIDGRTNTCITGLFRRSKDDRKSTIS